MWANSLSRKYPVTARQPNTPACKAKEAPAAEQSVAIPASWDLSDKQRSFIESFMDPKLK
ncbi:MULTISPECIES: hypothetical protein [Pantoea]|jgi:hypothetical protein|uniref:Uncharacterized protein n=1 Tax=Pantoea eucrina TaxID=472693 RepID=A0ABS1Z0X5_9GAMM|nr:MULTISPECIES: hypothetical protein [Pantoea]AIX51261.1 hypothetical protein PSNIH1_14030 [Pantoea sp. PSNIH1]KAA5972621.1 hypothetical protein F3I15_01030 [Pantoea sp. M_9]KAA6051111.1 hypothetical protein F3I35_03730 [Pantoea sp. Bo_7]KAA6095464.1 hypothetical protein F3I22_03735 [Pantoea sp. Bo_10]MBM0746037.1 hypothetical protein [Pantoea eucrina]